MHRGRKASWELGGELDSDGSAVLLQSRPAWMEIQGEVTPGWGTGTGQVEEGASVLAIQLKQQLSRLVWRLQQAGSCAARQTSCKSTNSLEKDLLEPP